MFANVSEHLIILITAAMQLQTENADSGFCSYCSSSGRTNSCDRRSRWKTAQYVGREDTKL